MNVYWFDLEVAGPVTGDHVEALGDALSASGGIDATAQGDHRGGRVMFSREADDAVQAIISAIEDTEAAGMTVTGVAADQVSVGEIAERPLRGEARSGSPPGAGRVRRARQAFRAR